MRKTLAVVNHRMAAIVAETKTSFHFWPRQRRAIIPGDSFASRQYSLLRLGQLKALRDVCGLNSTNAARSKSTDT
jgi:hypothetical protein